MKNVSKNALVRSRAKFGKKMSDSALAEFLSSLAAIYELEQSRNPPLADALRGLAKTLLRKTVRDVSANHEGFSHSTVGLKKGGPKQRRVHVGFNEALRDLSEEDVYRFINDESKTKEDLLEVAAARFSMPTSQLRRMRLVEVRQAVLSALLHENSIEIISNEAKREGNARTS